MRILVLAPQWPDPPRQGAAIRNLHILLYLARRHQVTLLTFTPDEGVIERSRLDPFCEYAEALPLPGRSHAQRLKTLLTSSLPDMAWRLRSEPMSQRVSDLTRHSRFDAIHIEGIEMAPYGLLASSNSKLKTQNSKLIYDAHNAEYLLQRRAFTTDLLHPRRFPRAMYSLVQWWRLRRFEAEVCERSAHVLAVSEADSRALARLMPSEPGGAGRIQVLPNGVDVDYWSPLARYEPVTIQGDALVFDGSMDFRPNVDAVFWFAAEVWPLVRAQRPEARFFVVGRNPVPDVRALAASPGITVTGAVDDPRPWVAGATVYVVPMRMGGGVRLKVLQAMAMERAIVSTPMGAEGISAEPGRDLLLARTPRDFAEAALSLLSDLERRSSLGRSARSLVSTRYAWPIILP
jgi:polysaccharide biosynthesis protein PslH